MARIKKRLLAASALTAAAILGTTTAASAGHYEEGAGGKKLLNQVSQVVQVCGNDRTNTGFLVIDFGSNDCGAVASTNTHDESFRWGKDGAHGGFLNGWEWFLNKYGW